MDSLASDYASGILASPGAPCLSIYLPTNRSHPDNQQDSTRFRNLVKSMKNHCAKNIPTGNARPLLELFKKLAENHEFWNHSVLAAPGIFGLYRLQRPAPELAVVAESFHVKPLLRILQSAGQYQVLGLARQGVRLFKGNRDVLDEVELSPEVFQLVAQTSEGKENERHVEV
jgi:hypothetical protein